MHLDSSGNDDNAENNKITLILLTRAMMMPTRVVTVLEILLSTVDGAATDE